MYLQLSRSIMEEYEVKAIRVWMREILESRDWSANRWATLAGTSPTNITRFLNGSKYVPSSKTLAKLSYIAGSSPELSQKGAISSSLARDIILRDAEGKPIGHMAVYNLKGDIEAFYFPRDLVAYGIDENDIVIIRKQKKFDEGNLVLYIDEDNFIDTYSKDERQRLGIGVKVANQNAIWKVRRKLTVPLSELHVLGKVVQIVKNLED